MGIQNFRLARLEELLRLRRAEYAAEEFEIESGNSDDSAFCASNTDAIVSAIAEISSAGGGVLRFKMGTYSFGRSSNVVGIILRDNVVLRGAGMDATTLRCRTGNGTLHFVGNLSSNGILRGSGIFDLTLDHNGPWSDPAAAQTHCVRLNGVDGFGIDHVKIKNSKQHAIATIGLNGDEITPVNKNIRVSNYHAENCGEDGLRIFYAAENVVATNITIRGAQLHALHLAAAGGSCNISNATVYQVAGTAFSAQSDGCNLSNLHAEWEITNDLLANRPAAGNPTAMFRDSATGKLYYDNGVEWIDHGTGLVNGVWAITRSGWPTGGKSNYSNIKCVLRIIENQPYVYDGTMADAFRLDVPNCECSNIIALGKFRFGCYLTESDNRVSGLHIDGTTDDGVRMTGSRNVLDDWRVVAATGKAVHLYGSNNKVINGYALDSTNVTTAVYEETGSDYNIVTGNHLTASGSNARVTRAGANSIFHSNTGISYQYSDVSLFAAPADTSENTLKSTTLRTGEFAAGETIVILFWGQCSGTAGTKAGKLSVGSIDIPAFSQLAAEQQDFNGTVFITRGTGTGYSIQAFVAEEGGTATFSGQYSSIASNWTVALKATKGDAGDTINALGLVIGKLG